MSKAERKFIRILLVDGHAMIREGLRSLLERNPDISVVGDTGQNKEAIEIASREQPDIILLDPTPGVDEGYGLLRDLLEVSKGARIIVLTKTQDYQLYRRAIDLGAMGLVSKQESSETLINAIHKVTAGEMWLERSATARLITEMLADARNKSPDPDTARIATLTPREREVIGLVSHGLKNKQIAQSLFISETTVSHHLTSIFNKLGVSDRGQLIIFGLSHGLNKS